MCYDLCEHGVTQSVADPMGVDWVSEVGKCLKWVKIVSSMYYIGSPV